MSALLEVVDLHAGYGRAEVLQGLSFTATEQSVVTVIGPNGAGKSTLLGALMGLIPSRSAALRFAGEDIARLTLEERVMAGLALVPEKRELFGSMTVEDNLLLGGWRPKKLGDKRWRDGLESVYARFPRLKERRAQQAGTLSGGERQMLALGRALMGSPKLLMLDEPSLGLAPLIVREHPARRAERPRGAARGGLRACAGDGGIRLERAGGSAGGGSAGDRDVPRRGAQAVVARCCSQRFTGLRRQRRAVWPSCLDRAAMRTSPMNSRRSQQRASTRSSLCSNPLKSEISACAWNRCSARQMGWHSSVSRFQIVAFRSLRLLFR
jgi:branched-chain amino acid transport system ATP-binding protein